MSSVIFQPLLHDSLGWKTSHSTYTDAFTWKSDRSSNKEKKISTYGQQYQRKLRKQQKLQQTNASLPPATNQEQTIQRIILVKDNRGQTPVSHRASPIKTPSLIVTEELPTVNVENKQRPASTNRETTCGSRASQRSSTAVEEISSPGTLLDVRQSSKEEKEKILTDPTNDNTRHWITYPNPKTPQYLLDIKERLGQLKVPSAPIRPATALNETTGRPESSSSVRPPQQPSADQRHMFDFNLPETPKELRASRRRFEKHRYNPSLDDHPPRPRTCPVRTSESSKPSTPPNNAPEFEDESLPPSAVNNDLWTEENKSNEYENSTMSIQTIDLEGLPSAYVEAVETANIAQEEYLKNIRINQETKSDHLVYRLPSMPSDNQSESLMAYHQQKQSTPPTNTNSTRPTAFGTWVRNATDKERQSAMKILRDVLHQPALAYDIPTKQPTTNRINSAPRKLGRTRSVHQRIPCEICEKEMIKHHVWNLSRSDTLTCPHQAQGMKPPLIQIRS